MRRSTHALLLLAAIAALAVFSAFRLWPRPTRESAVAGGRSDQAQPLSEMRESLEAAPANESEGSRSLAAIADGEEAASLDEAAGVSREGGASAQIAVHVLDKATSEPIDGYEVYAARWEGSAMEGMRYIAVGAPTVTGPAGSAKLDVPLLQSGLAIFIRRDQDAIPSREDVIWALEEGERRVVTLWIDTDLYSQLPRARARA